MNSAQEAAFYSGSGVTPGALFAFIAGLVMFAACVWGVIIIIGFLAKLKEEKDTVKIQVETSRIIIGVMLVLTMLLVVMTA